MRGWRYISHQVSYRSRALLSKALPYAVVGASTCEDENRLTEPARMTEAELKAAFIPRQNPFVVGRNPSE